jgi:lipoate-protein ligase A
MKSWRYIPYKACHAFENMATDEALIEFYMLNKTPVLRLYSWQPAGISIGKYQDAVKDINVENCRNDNTAIVRRMTGGGAILHDNELTYCIVCSEEDIRCKKAPVKKSFEKLNSFIMRLYLDFGLNPVYAKDVIGYPRPGERPGFCFSGNEEYDIIIANRKVGGNAQARKKGLIFQHGSIPLSINREKTSKYFNANIDYSNFSALNEFTNKQISVFEIVERFLAAFDRTFRFGLKEQDLAADEKHTIKKLINEKYSKDEWNLKNTANGQDAPAMAMESE